MNRMLKQLFIKDYKNTSDPQVRKQYGSVAGGFGIVSNLLLGVFKLIIGVASCSVSIMADAVNNLSDMASSILTIVGFKLASKKPDSKNPYGHARYEYVTAFIIALLMFEMGILFAKESIVKIIHPQELCINTITYIVLGVAIAVKVIQMLIYKDYAKAIDSGSLRASAEDTRNDIISSSAILVSMVVMGITGINIDGYLGLAVSLFVIWSSLCTMGEELEPIIGIKPTKEQVQVISDKLKSYPCVLGIHDLVLHNYGVNNDFATVHVEIDSSIDALKAHDMIDNIEFDFKREMGLAMTIHMDPVLVNNEKLEFLKTQVKSIINEFDPELSIHDFRMVEGETHVNLVFDCVVPFGKNCTKDDIVSLLCSRMNKEGDVPFFNFVIEMDRPFC